jgi:hypothetical protein
LSLFSLPLYSHTNKAEKKNTRHTYIDTFFFPFLLVSARKRTDDLRRRSVTTILCSCET